MPRFASSSDDTPIAYDVQGDGAPALVLVHGWSCDRGYWNAQVGPLAREFQVVTIDLAGHGESGCDRHEWSIAGFGSDVAAVVNDLGIKDAVLVGHSMGGDVILEAARLLPGLVRALVWVDTYSELPHSTTPQEVLQRMTPFRADFAEATRVFVRAMFGPGTDASLVERIALDMSDAPVDVALGAMEAAWTFGDAVPALLSELRLPVFAINPDDSSTDVESMRRFGVDVILLPRVGHFPMMEDPQAFNEQLMKFARGVSRRWPA